jgi:anti-sigma-K factor RskA
MNTPMNDPELDALLGAYALDALDPEERALVEDYVEHNPRARAEVDELRESAAALALSPVDDLRAPDGLWDRISASIAESDEQVAPPVSLDELRERRRKLTTRTGALLAVAASIVAVVLAVQVISLSGRLDDAREPGAASASAAFERAKSESGARQIALAPAEGAEVARIVLLPDGTGYLKNDGMKQLDSQQTYQLWALIGDRDKPTAISAGVLGSDPRAAAFKAAGDVHGFALTIENSPGVVSSQQPAYASATLS